MKNILRNRKRQKAPKKERVTVSLSQGAVKFLRATRAQLEAPSMSALLEKIVADLQSRAEQQSYEMHMRAYYDSLPPAAVQEGREWGALGEAALQQPDTER